MTDFTSPDRDVNRAIRSWLREDRHEDASRVAGAVLDQVEATPRRRTMGWPARRTEPMNKIAWLGLGAAAVVVALVIGAQLLGSGPGGFGAGSIDTPEPSVADPTVTPEPSIAEPSPSTAADLEGSYVLSEEVGITVTIPAPGWSITEHEAPAKNGNYSPPDGAYVFGPWHGFDFYIPGDPCQWSSTMPDSPATTLEEIVAALASQASRDASAPVDVTVDGHPGKSITLRVPDDIGHSAGRFDCDEGKFCTFADAGGCHMWNAQGPGAIDELWFIDLDDEVIAVTGGYYPDTPEEDIGELRAILGSMTFSK
jgi:hypothetical protein